MGSRGARRLRSATAAAVHRRRGAGPGLTTTAPSSRPSTEGDRRGDCHGYRWIPDGGSRRDRRCCSTTRSVSARYSPSSSRPSGTSVMNFVTACAGVTRSPRYEIPVSTPTQSRRGHHAFVSTRPVSTGAPWLRGAPRRPRILLPGPLATRYRAAQRPRGPAQGVDGGRAPATGSEKRGQEFLGSEARMYRDVRAGPFHPPSNDRALEIIGREVLAR